MHFFLATSHNFESENLKSICLKNLPNIHTDEI